MSILKNCIWNLIGYIIPSIIAIPALGYLSRKLGNELFGIYTIITVILNCAGIFDIGLTRAITREIAIYRDNCNERKKIISTVTIFLVILGFLGSGTLIFFSSSITYFLNTSPEDFSNISNLIKILAFLIPLFLLNQLWVAILEGDEKFKLISIQKIITSTLFSSIPAIFLIFNSSFYAAVAGLVSSRIISIIISFFLVKDEIIQSGIKLDLVTIRRLISLGRWFSISNILTPVISYSDRFIISNMLGVKHIAYYTGPSEAIARLSTIPAAFCRVLFPKLSCTQNIDEIKKNIMISCYLMFIFCLPIVITGTVLGGEILNIWLGTVYSIQSKNIFSILLVGFLFNAIAQVPFTFIQSIGKAKITALLHFMEIIPYSIILFILLRILGLKGVAYAWTIRVIIDCFILIFISNSLLKNKE